MKKMFAGFLTLLVAVCGLAAQHEQHVKSPAEARNGYGETALERKTAKLQRLAVTNFVLFSAACSAVPFGAVFGMTEVMPLQVDTNC